jgi:RimJ/RimL family protein N-acetyltransferase
MIERTMDAAFFNRICNLPECRPWLAGGTEPIDTTAVVENPQNFALRNAHGGFILLNHGRGTYSVHSQFASEGRGTTVAAMRAGFDFMFTRTDCMKIYSHVPDKNRAAQSLAKAAGFRPWFRRDMGALGPTQMVSLDVDTWIAGNEELEADGKQFHDLLEAAKAESGSTLPHHDDDPVHDRYVGAATRMCSRGQADKGVTLYNLWADAAGYQRIELLQDNPPVVDVVDAIVGLTTGGNLQVLTCR